MDKLSRVQQNGYNDVRSCEWVEGTPFNDGMICMSEEYFEELQNENAFYRIEDFVEFLPAPLRILVRPFILPFNDKYLE